MAGKISASFKKRYAQGPVIDAADLRIDCEGMRITVLFGESGSGKTTVLRCLAGLERPDEGLIRFGEETWFDAAGDVFISPQARHIGFLSQDYALFPHLTVEGNIRYGLRQVSSAERRLRVAEAMRWLGLEGLERRLPRQLSGGQQQRVALARTVVRRPRLLLLDEPLSALDAPTRVRLRGELRRLLRQLGIPAVLVTHDRTEALTLGDEVVILEGGKIVQSGPVQEVFSRPASVSAASILGVETVQPGTIVESSEDLTLAAVGKARVAALGQAGAPGEHVFVCIRAEEVILFKGGKTQTSARNQLAGRVAAVEREGPMLRVDLDVGFPLVALLTKQAGEELELKPGESVLALVKAPHVHLIPRPGGEI